VSTIPEFDSFVVTAIEAPLNLSLRASNANSMKTVMVDNRFSNESAFRSVAAATFVNEE
jgi:hypothetical protein